MASFNIPPEFLAQMQREQARMRYSDFGRKPDETVIFPMRGGDPTPPKPKAPSKFDGPDVIDLVLADGVWTVPSALEARVRAL